jgi:predicted flap endonuclease-1-like 5' DNA nuclease
MDNQPDDIRKWIQDLITRSATDQLENLKRFEQMLQKVARGEVDQSRVRDEYVNFARDESLRYINDLTRVGLGFYNTLLELNRHYNERFFEHVTSDPRASRQPGRSEPRIVTMDMHAPLGEVAAHSFVIENHRPEPIDVSFLVSEFAVEAGATQNGEPFEQRYIRPALQLNPPRFTLRPGEERRVDMRIPLPVDLLIPGEVYTATVVVSGFEALQLRLRLWADPAHEAGIDIHTASDVQTPNGPEKTTAPAESGHKVLDDLTRLKGIGPVFEKKLHAAGIHTYAELAAVEEELLIKHLGAGAAGRAQAQQWRSQAQLAARGEWAEIEQLHQGRE